MGMYIWKVLVQEERETLEETGYAKTRLDRPEEGVYLGDRCGKINT